MVMLRVIAPAEELNAKLPDTYYKTTATLDDLRSIWNPIVFLDDEMPKTFVFPHPDDREGAIYLLLASNNIVRYEPTDQTFGLMSKATLNPMVLDYRPEHEDWLYVQNRRDDLLPKLVEVRAITPENEEEVGAYFAFAAPLVMTTGEQSLLFWNLDTRTILERAGGKSVQIMAEGLVRFLATWDDHGIPTLMDLPEIPMKRVLEICLADKRQA